MDNAITILVGNELRGTLPTANGSLCGIPFDAGRDVKFNPMDKLMTRIGPNFRDDVCKWYRGAIIDSGVMYCPPSNSRRRGILKIDTNTDTVTELDRNLLPKRGNCMWLSCAATLDGCIYFMPFNARRVMKLDPNNGDAISSVGDDSVRD